MRAFIAIDLPEELRAELIRTQQRLRDSLAAGAIGWTPPTNWHLTLAFLGEVADAAPVVEAVRGACAATGPLELALGGLGTFGDRVIWAGLEGPGKPALVNLTGAISRACAALGFEADDRPYSPHVTLARARNAGRGGRGRAPGGQRGRGGRAGGGDAQGGGSHDIIGVVRATPPPAPLAFTARELVLFESKLGGPHPATYVAHARVPLQAPRPTDRGDTLQDSPETS